MQTRLCHCQLMSQQRKKEAIDIFFGGPFNMPCVLGNLLQLLNLNVSAILGRIPLHRTTIWGDLCMGGTDPMASV